MTTETNMSYAKAVGSKVPPARNDELVNRINVLIENELNRSVVCTNKAYEAVADAERLSVEARPDIEPIWLLQSVTGRPLPVELKNNELSLSYDYFEGEIELFVMGQRFEWPFRRRLKKTDIESMTTSLETLPVPVVDYVRLFMTKALDTPSMRKWVRAKRAIMWLRVQHEFTDTCEAPFPGDRIGTPPCYSEDECENYPNYGMCVDDDD